MIWLYKMKYSAICFGFLSLLTVIYVSATIEKQNQEEKTEHVEKKPLTEQEMKTLEEDTKKSLILVEKYGKFTPPYCTFREVNSSRIIYATSREISTYGFCPPEKPLTGDYKNCLMPSEVDSCTKRVEPFIMLEKEKTGEQSRCANGRGKLYAFGFQACNYVLYFLGIFDGEIYRISPTKIYTFCYDEKSEQVLYTFRRIISPSVLNSKLLENERKITYRTRTNDFNLFNNRFERIKPLFSKERLAETGLVMQYIVPPEDMAFRIWKRTTCHFVNAKLVLKKTAQLLDHISDYIRKKAIARLGEATIADGFQPSDSLEVNIWWKIVYSEGMRSAIAIIIHNTKNTPTQEEKLCSESICEKYKWIGLIPEDMTSHAYCCLPYDIVKNNGLPTPKKTLNPEKWRYKYLPTKQEFRELFC